MVRTVFNTFAGILICGIILFAGCATEPEPEPEKPAPPVEEKAPPVEKKPDIPDWANVPPVEDGFIFGIASNTDEENAKVESLADMAWQMSAQAYSVCLKDYNTNSALKEELAVLLGEQMVKAVILEAEIADTYHSSSGETWVLSRKKTNWVLDILESLLVFHASKLGITIDAEALVSEVEQRLATERVGNPGIESPDDIPELLGDIAGGRKPLPTSL